MSTSAQRTRRRWKETEILALGRGGCFGHGFSASLRAAGCVVLRLQRFGNGAAHLDEFVDHATVDFQVDRTPAARSLSA
jgi:hypothetical protein